MIGRARELQRSEHREPQIFFSQNFEDLVKMPMKKSHKKTSRKSTKWLTKYKPRDTVIYRPDVGLGRSVATRLKTVLFSTIDISAGTIIVSSLLPGSAFNPMGTLSAIQPASYDQWKVLFARYVVTGATVHIDATPSIAQSAVSEPASVVAAYPSTVVGPAAGSATFQGYASQPYAQSKLVTTGLPCANMYFKLSAQKIVGSRLPVIAEDQGALVTGSPTTGENMVLPICNQSVIGAATGNNVTLKITIIQDVVFDQRIQVVDA